MTLNSKRIVDLATNLRLPTVYQTAQFIEDGELMGYEVNYGDPYRRAAIYVDEITEGADLQTTRRASDGISNYPSTWKLPIRSALRFRPPWERRG